MCMYHCEPPSPWGSGCASAPARTCAAWAPRAPQSSGSASSSPNSPALAHFVHSSKSTVQAPRPDFWEISTWDVSNWNVIFEFGIDFQRRKLRIYNTRVLLRVLCTVFIRMILFLMINLKNVPRAEHGKRQTRSRCVALLKPFSSHS